MSFLRHINNKEDELMLKKMLGKKRGFSLLGSLLGFSLLGLSTVGLATYMGNFEQTQVQYAEQSDMTFKHKTLLETMRSMLVGVQVKVANNRGSVVNSSGESHFKIYGLCGLVGEALTHANAKDKFFCPISIARSDILNGVSLGFNTLDRWKYFLKVISGGSWVVATGTPCANNRNGFFGDFTADHFNKCLKFERANEDPIYARVQVIPQVLPSFEKVRSSGDSISVDELSFQLVSTVSTPSSVGAEKTYTISNSKKIVLASEVLECHICDGVCSRSTKNYVLARLSTNSLDSSKHQKDMCYHSGNATETAICDALSVDYVSKNVLQAGQINSDRDAGGTILESNTARNVAVSCSSHVFRCKNNPSRFNKPEELDPTLRMTFGFYLDTILKASSIDKIDFKVGAHTLPALYDAGDGNARVGRDKTGQKTFDQDKTLWPLPSGSTQVTAYASAKAGNSNICTPICRSRTHRPSPTLKVQWNKVIGGSACNKDFNLGASPHNVNVQCTVCHMKNCHRYGVGTFGPAFDRAGLSGLAAEPLDGSVPECVVYDTHSPSTTAHTVSGASSLSKKCMKKTSSGFRTEDCGTAVSFTDSGYAYTSGTHKTACFVNGETKTITGGESTGLKANLNCLAPLEEKQRLGSINTDGRWTKGLLPNLALAYNLPPRSLVSNDRSIRGILEDAGLSITTDSDHGDIIRIKNSVNMATYFGDSTSAQAADAWVNIQRDAAGMFHEGWPAMIKGGDWSFFYREPFEGLRYTDSGLADDIKKRTRPARPIYVKMGSDFHEDYPNTKETVSGSNVKALLLTHHLKFRGLRGVKNQISRPLPYLCRNVNANTIKDMFKLSTIKGRNLVDGYSACQQLGSNWYFIPPDSRKLWAAALQTVAPNAPRYSFPNPFNFIDGVPFINSSGSLSFKYSEVPSDTPVPATGRSDFVKSKNSDHHIVITNDLLATPASAWVGLKPLSSSTTSSPSYHQSWDWTADWARLLGGAGGIGSDSIFNFDRNQATLYNRMNAAIAGTDFTGRTGLSGVIDKAGNAVNVEKLRNLFGTSNIHNKFTKICISKDDNEDLWTHRSIVVRGKQQDWPGGNLGNKCKRPKRDGGRTFLSGHPAFGVGNVNVAKLENLSDAKLKNFGKGIRSIEAILKFYIAGAYHIQNEEKFCHIWNAEKLRRATGQCVVKAYNNSNSSKALTISTAKHSKRITESVRPTATCHTGGRLCDGASSYYQRLLDETTNIASAATRRATLQTLLSGIKNKCMRAVNVNSHSQSYRPSGLNLSVDNYTYNFNEALDSRCWSIEKLSPTVSMEYQYGSASEKVSGTLKVTEEDSTFNSWDKNSKASGSSSGLHSLRLNVFSDLPDIGDDDLCDDDDINGSSDSYTDYSGKSNNCVATTTARASDSSYRERSSCSLLLPNSEWSSSRRKCICRSTYERVGEACLVKCDSTEIRDSNNKCKCPGTTALSGGKCVSSCPTGEQPITLSAVWGGRRHCSCRSATHERVGGVCRTKCKSTSIRGSDHICRCPGTQAFSNGVCVSSCPPNKRKMDIYSIKFCQ